MSIPILDLSPSFFLSFIYHCYAIHINRFWKRFTVAKHVQYCCRKLAFSIGIASSFTIGPLDSINRASSHLRRSTLGRTVRFSPSLVSPRRSCCHRLSLSFPLTRPPPLTRSPLIEADSLSLSPQSGELGRRIGSGIRFLLWGCQRVRNFPRQYACIRERWNNAIWREKGRSKRDLGGGEWNNTDWRERGRELRSRVAREKGGVNEMIETRWCERTRDTALL